MDNLDIFENASKYFLEKMTEFKEILKTVKYLSFDQITSLLEWSPKKRKDNKVYKSHNWKRIKNHFWKFKSYKRK